MLSLLLAFSMATPLAAQRDPQAGSILLVCDTPYMSLGCGLYVRGFTDAVLALAHVSNDGEQRACLPDNVDLNAVRLGIVRELKGADSTQPAKVLALLALSRVYPCP